MSYRHIRLWIALGAISLIAAGCPNQQSADLPAVDAGAVLGPQAWIDAPLDGMTIPLAPYEVVAHATSPYGVVSFEFSVNGVVEDAAIVPASQLGESLAHFRRAWTPPAPGTYLLSVRGFDSNGEPGVPAEARVIVESPPLDEAVTDAPTPQREAPTPTDTPSRVSPTPTITLTPTASATATLPPPPPQPPTDTPTPTVTPSPTQGLPTIFSFTANPAQIEPGGSSNLNCEITGATNADIFGNPVDPNVCSFPVFPSETTDYVLRACSGATDDTCSFAIVTVFVPTPTPGPPQCSDGLDNDGDGRVDYNATTPSRGDLECTDANDNDESS